jgi:hypothetical protein
MPLFSSDDYVFSRFFIGLSLIAGIGVLIISNSDTT